MGDAGSMADASSEAGNDAGGNGRDGGNNTGDGGSDAGRSDAAGGSDAGGSDAGGTSGGDAGGSDGGDASDAGDSDAGGADADAATPLDSDGDGVPDDEDAFPDDPDERVDSDGDGVGDEGDGEPENANACGDVDSDSCDDCSGGAFDPEDDGTDTDADGLCDVCDATLCSSGGHCEPMDEEVICVCDPGLSNADCSIDVDACAAADAEDGNPCNESDTAATCDDAAAPETGYSCGCSPGFEAEDGACVDVDECTAQTNPCDEDGDASAVWTDTDGSYTCSCSSGFEGSTGACVNVDECTAQDNPCDEDGDTLASCTDLDGSYECGCSSGYGGDGVCVPSSCSALLVIATTTSGVYTIDPDGDGDAAAFDTYCDMETDGGGWTLILSSDLSPALDAICAANTNNCPAEIHGYFDGGGAGSANHGTADYKAPMEATAMEGLRANELRVDTVSGQRVVIPGLTTMAGFGVDYTSCNAAGRAIGTDVYWHAGRAGCYGSTHFGVSTGTGNVHSDSAGALHYGHFHELGWNDGVYVFADINLNENEWEERYSYWLRTSLPPDCDAILSSYPDAPDGDYLIDPDGSGGQDPSWPAVT